MEQSVIIQEVVEISELIEIIHVAWLSERLGLGVTGVSSTNHAKINESLVVLNPLTPLFDKPTGDQNPRCSVTSVIFLPSSLVLTLLHRKLVSVDFSR